MRKYYYNLIVFITLLFLYSNNSFTQYIYTGFRSSRILNSYPNKVFPSQNYWVNTGKTIAEKFSSATPAGVWIVSLYWGSGEIGMDFPSSGYNIPYVTFLGTDYSEPYLSRFDQEGIKIWLQVEPGAASVDTLIHIVLNRYKHHTCVIGFGIDVEWLDAQSNNGGRKVTNVEAERWENKVKSINPNYTLFLKHYSSSWMPPNYRGNIIFVDDSQDFTFSSNPFNAMINEFKAWGNKFYPNKVAFQFGYPADKTWWSKLADPMKEIGSSLLANISNITGLFWVDFTLTQLFPVSVKNCDNIKNCISKFEITQNYPNPFNPKTTISFRLPALTATEGSNIKLSIYDIMGKEVAVLENEYKQAGDYKVEWDAGGFPSGIYYYKLTTGNGSFIRKMILQK